MSYRIMVFLMQGIRSTAFRSYRDKIRCAQPARIDLLHFYRGIVGYLARPAYIPIAQILRPAQALQLGQALRFVQEAP